MEDGVKYQFNALRLKMLIDQKKASLQKAKQKVTQTAIREQLAEKAFVSPEAIKNWMYGNNAPSDLEQVKILAEYFDVDYHQLLREEKEMTNTTEIRYDLTNDVQKQYTRNIVRSLYQNIRDLLNEIDQYSWEFSEKTDGDPEVFFSEDNMKKVREAYGVMISKYRALNKQLQYAMLDIPEDFYNRVSVFLDENIYGMIKSTANPNIERYSNEDEFVDIMSDLDWVTTNFEEGVTEEWFRKVFEEYIVK